MSLAVKLTSYKQGSFYVYVIIRSKSVPRDSLQKSQQTKPQRNLLMTRI